MFSAVKRKFLTEGNKIMKKLLLIINPRAGKMRNKTSLFEIVDIFNKHDCLVTVMVTQRAGHARQIAFDNSSDYDITVCSGGDGTLNEVVGGVISSGSKKPIGYIPSGSTNDFASTLNLSKDFRRAALDIVQGVPKPIDIGMFDGRYFSYVASFGAFTKASYSTSQDVKNALGHLAYVLEGIKDIPSIRAEHVKIETTTGDLYEGDYIFGAIANSTSVGGIININDKLVMMNDGKFELLLIKKPKNIVELNKCINALITQNYNCDMIEFGAIENAKITTDNKISWSLDGERADTNGYVEVKNLHNAITMILPSATAEMCIV